MKPKDRLKDRWLQGRTLARKLEGHDDKEAMIMAIEDWNEQERLGRCVNNHANHREMIECWETPCGLKGVK